MTKEEAASVLQNYIVDDLKFSNRGLNIAYEIKSSRLLLRDLVFEIIVH